MAAVIPIRLLSCTKGNFEVVDTRTLGYGVYNFDIITYTWGDPVKSYDCKIDGVTWEMTINEQKLKDIKRLMMTAEIQYLWVDCICINQADPIEQSIELDKMYDYYKSASNCFVLLDMVEVWDPQMIVNNLSFIDHVLSNMCGAAIASETRLTPNILYDLAAWADTTWTFPMDKSSVRTAAIDLGVLNCYSTCISRIRSLFHNAYFTRVWTFQEILLGKNITMYGINKADIRCIGTLEAWMNLAQDGLDKAIKLIKWVNFSRALKTATIFAILGEIEEDVADLDSLQSQVIGIRSARMDIINGGRHWWYENHKGILNIFSAISLMPRECGKKRDIFVGLLGIFNGLFTQAERDADMMTDDMERSSFTFFKQLSHRTGYAWTSLAISSEDRGQYDWIPKVANANKILTTDCFAGVVNLGRLKPNGIAKSYAMTGILGTPEKYMKISINQGVKGFYFNFRGCNAGKKISTGLFKKSDTIPVQNGPIRVPGDETGRILVQCATLLGAIMDPVSGGYGLVEYRRRLLDNLDPYWRVTDPNAKPGGWKDRCVSGTHWENPNPLALRVHNWSMNYQFDAIYDIGSRLHNKTTEDISCAVRVNCGCTIIAPFSLLFEAITAVHGSSLGGKRAFLVDNRIISKDGAGLIQVGDIGRSFDLVAFGGNVYSHPSYSDACRNTKQGHIVEPKYAWPVGRALVRDEFQHGIMDTALRDYGYVKTGGAGNLLIMRNSPIGDWKIVGVCIDEDLEAKKGVNSVNIR
jgi:hypothetical protein